jgi:hypothetical protein
MTEENFPELLKGFIAITLFAFLIVAIVMLFGSQYSKDTSDVTGKFGAEQINNTLNSAKATSDAWYSAFQKQNIFSTVAGIIVTGIFQLAKTMVNFIFTPFSILSNIMTAVLGIPPVVVNVVYVLLIISIIFGIWRIITKRF